MSFLLDRLVYSHSFPDHSCLPYFALKLLISFFHSGESLASESFSASLHSFCVFFATSRLVYMKSESTRHDLEPQLKQPATRRSFRPRTSLPSFPLDFKEPSALGGFVNMIGGACVFGRFRCPRIPIHTEGYNPQFTVWLCNCFRHGHSSSAVSTPLVVSLDQPLNMT